MSTLLDVKNLGISFGGLRAVNDFDLKIQKEELYGLIGPNRSEERRVGKECRSRWSPYH